jgi:hypothetical protein
MPDDLIPEIDDTPDDAAQNIMVPLWQKELRRLVRTYPVAVSAFQEDGKLIESAEAILFLCAHLEAAGYDVAPEIDRLGGIRN